jgi:hypothetical protein
LWLVKLGLVFWGSSVSLLLCLATRDKGSNIVISKGGLNFLTRPKIGLLKNTLILRENKKPMIQFLEYGGKDFDSDVAIEIRHKSPESAPETAATLEILELILKVTQQSISTIKIVSF